MSALRSAVYVAPPIPVTNPETKAQTSTVWSPISCTLIYGSKEAVLVDTPITIAQTQDLIQWIKKIAPGRKLSYIYITHGHGDHFFGIPVLLEHFPEAQPVATEGTVKHMEQQVETKNYNEVWEARFPGQIAKPFKLANKLPKNKQFKIENKWICEAVECGHTDTYDSTVLWVPEIRLAVCGDVVYGQVHQMLLEANTKAKREEWIRAVEKVERLNPAYVVPGHRQAEEIDGIWHLQSTKKYIEDYGEVLKGNPANAREIYAAMTKLYPDRFNPGALAMSAKGAFMVPKESRI